MKIYKLTITALSTLLAALLGIGCSGPRVIPDEDLVKIFHDAYIANAYIDECRIREDSLLLYEPIFKRYGYTIEDLHHTITTFSERKSAMLSNLMADVNRMLDEESRQESRRMVVLDTIDNIAKRAYTRTVYADSLIRAKSMRDTLKLRITIDSIIPGDYDIAFEYLIDTLDENRNSRVEIFFINKDSSESERHTMMLSRYRDGKYSRKFKADTTKNKLHINLYYHPRNEESKLPDITVRNLRVVRILPTEVCVDSLYLEQLGIRMINHELMSSFTADTVDIVETEIITPDSLERYDQTDSLTLRTN